jgi:hypothetical protein
VVVNSSRRHHPRCDGHADGDSPLPAGQHPEPLHANAGLD